MLGAASPAFSLRSHVTQAGVPSGPAEAEEGPATHLRLDQFLRKYTSEDNASFSKILDKVNRKQAVKSAHLREGERESQQLLTGPGEGTADGAPARSAAPTDGFGTSNQPTDRLTLWPYKSANALYYWGADAPLTEGELAERTKGPPKEINQGATRFHGNVFDKGKREETVILYEPVSETPTEDSILKRKVEEMKNAYTQGERGQGRAYSYVATPSPAPGVDASPFMTWGEIEGTPLRLEAEDTPVGIGGGEGPTFKIPAPPPRDRQAHLLSRKATSNLRARQEIMAGRTPRTPAGGASPVVGGRSAAGQKLVNKAMGKSGKDIDVGLRQSYRASPARSKTPATPSSRRGSGWPSRDTPVSTRAPSESPYMSKTGERNQTGDLKG
jgi:protein DGCR14